MGHRIISFTIDNERILRILDKAGKYKLRSALIVRALEVVDLEGLLRELLRELITNEEPVKVKESSVKSQEPTELTKSIEETREEKVRILREEISDWL